MYKKNQKIWNNNTHPCVSLKTQLSSDRYAINGKSYLGLLRRDVECEEFRYDEHFTFVEIQPQQVRKRSQQVFRSEFITITRAQDGTFRPNFRSVRVGPGFNYMHLATAVANELIWG